MNTRKITEITKEIKETKKGLMGLGEMRPGNLTKQYKNRERKEGGFWQLSYTYKGRSRSKLVREEEKHQIEEEIATYNKYKELTQRWIDLSIELSMARIAKQREI